jgi:hypothetical protein
MQAALYCLGINRILGSLYITLICAQAPVRQVGEMTAPTAIISAEGEPAEGPKIRCMRTESSIVLAISGELPRVFRTGNLRLIHAASCSFRYSSMTSCGVR